MLLRNFSNHALLAELRIEDEIFFLENVSDSNERKDLLDFTRIKENCPLLVSTWQEVLRMNSYLPSGRTVMQDTMVQGQYLLKKDATVFIFSGVLQSDAKSWGLDVAEFNPRRFLKGENQNKVHPAAFRPFGGGHVFCPERIFAFTEVLAFVEPSS
jgi:cytochrome P450